MIDYEIKSQRPTANGQTLFLVEIKSQSLSRSEQGTKYVMHKKGIYEFSCEH